MTVPPMHHASALARAHLRRSLAVALSAFAGLALAIALVLGVLSTPAGAQNVSIDGVAGIDETTTTPIRSEVWAIEKAEGVMIVGGKFTDVVDRSSSTHIPHPYLAAFDASTGEFIPAFRATPDGPVYDIKYLGDWRVLIAGEFQSVNGLSGTEGLAIVDIRTGEVDTNFRIDLAGGNPVVRSVAVDGSSVYVVGGFSGIKKASNSSFVSVSNAARVRLSDGAIHDRWNPTLDDEGWGVAVSGGSRVHIGGYFSSVNGADGTDLIATVDRIDGDLLAGWDHGYKYNRNYNWSTLGAAVNDLDVVGNNLFVAGAKHYISVINATDGSVIRHDSITNDGQSVDVSGASVLIGCHCSIDLAWTKVYSGSSTLEGDSSDSTVLRGAAGTWASELAGDGCVWHGGNFTSAGGTTPVHNLARTCSGGGGSVGTQPVFDLSDRTAPSVPGAPTIVGQQASSITLTWPAASDDRGQVRYHILRNGVRVGVSGTNSYTDAFIGSGNFDWQVIAVDMTGNASAPSARSARINLAPAVNSAAGRAATDEDGNTIGALTDGSTTVSSDNFTYATIDLGAVRSVESVEILGASRDRVRVFWSEVPFQAETVADLLDSPTAQGTQLGLFRDRVIPVSTTARYVRVLQQTGTIALAELRVWTGSSYASRSPRGTDTQDPSTPAWRSLTTLGGGQTLMRWGPEQDNTGVAYYTVLHDGVPVATTTEPWFIGTAAELPTSSTDIIAHDADGNASAVVVVPQIPIAPASCSASAANGVVTLTWAAANNDNASDYVIRRRRDGSAFFWRAKVAGNASSFSDSNVVSGASYGYTVETINGADRSAVRSCLPANVTVAPTNTAAIRPASCTATESSPTQVRVTWTAAANDNADDYVIRRSRNGGSFFWTGTSATSTFANNNVGAGTYRYTVEARNASGNSATRTCSPTGGVTMGASTAPVAPLSCTASQLSANQIRVTWTAAANDNGNDYIIRRSRNGGPHFWAGASATGTFTNNNVGAGTYGYTVETRSTSGNSSATTCGPNGGVIMGASTAAVAPASCTATRLSTNQIRVTWTASANDNADDYVIRRSRNRGAYFWAGASETGTFTNNNVGAGTYRYTIEARNASGNSSATTCGPDAGVTL